MSKSSKYKKIYDKLDRVTTSNNAREKMAIINVKPRLEKQRKTKIIVITSVVVALILVGGFFIWRYLLMPNIVLKKGNVVIDYKDKYKDPGYKAYYIRKNITKMVKISNNINSKKLGKYRVIYTVKYGMFTDKKIRVVTVKDTLKPKLKLAGTGDIYVCPESKYKEEAYSAIDNYDGDITKKVKVTIKKDKITYSVTDNAGNNNTITRKIKYEDIEKPTISLTDGDTISVASGSSFTDPGYSASDNCDGDISKNVTVSGSVNTGAIGTYSLTYTVSDKAGNAASATRTVKVVDNKGVIYLTFDDGPSAATTGDILDILKAEGVQATFFVTCSGPDSLIKREYDEGHAIGLHTASHNYALVYSSVTNYFNDLNRVSARVKSITGFDSKIIRFPGGSSNTISRHYSSGIMSTLTKEVVNRGYRYFDWNVSSGDAEAANPPVARIISNTEAGLSHNRINMVLMHDIKGHTRDALKTIIEWAKSNGYTFSKITDTTPMITQHVNN
jgi:peptidoglycan/xylan/chitin deacetylase (PgdA/CDA1 family)